MRKPYIQGQISIHSLARGRTVLSPEISLLRAISIHSLARGRTTYIRCCPHGYGQFQSTPSQEGEQAAWLDEETIIKFQSTPSQEGERQSAFSSGQTMIFQSTPSQEGERSADGLMSADDKFQSTPSQEGELRFRVQFHQKIYNFNPLPRKREN